MTRPLGIPLMVAGLFLIVHCLQFSQFGGTEHLHLVTGAAGSKSSWELLGGMAGLVAGGVMNLRATKS